MFVSLFVFIFCLGRATRLVTCVHRLLFLLALYILTNLVFNSFIHLFTPPPPCWDSGLKTRICSPHPHATGKRRLEWGGFSE